MANMTTREANLALRDELRTVKRQDILTARGDFILAVPSYYWPDDTWTTGDRRWRRAAASGARITVANPNSGPGTTADANFTRAIAENSARGVATLGYVRTDYGRIAAATVKATVDTWYSLYPGIDGIFFDESDNGTGQVGGLTDPAGHYTDLVGYVRAKDGRAITCLNPGTDWQTETMANIADIGMTFEHDAASYLAKTSVPDYQRTARTRNWHCIYGATIDQLDALVAKARELGASHLYITDDALDPNPYDSLPPAAFLDAVTGRAAAATTSTGGGSTATTAELDAAYTP